MVFDETDARLTWVNDIMPFVFRRAKAQLHPTTVFIGGQPAAGKTSGQELARNLHQDITPIVGDDYRQYHPDYKRLLEENPLHMPEVTAELAGVWTGMCVKHADEYGYPIIIEGTWRNPATVLDEAERCKRLGRTTHAIIVATPPLVSRAGMIDRCCSSLIAGEAARWTPPDHHDKVVEALCRNVPMIAGNDLIDRFTVTDRSGRIIADSATARNVVEAWRQRFDAVPTFEEQQEIHNAINLAHQCETMMDPDDYDRLRETIDEVNNQLFGQVSRAYMEHEQFRGKWVQNRRKDGSYAPGGHWG